MRLSLRFSASPRVTLSLILTTAFLVRLLHVLTYDLMPIGDMQAFLHSAAERLTWERIFSPEGLITVPPGYVFYLKPFLLLFSWEAALLASRIGHAVLGAAACFSVFQVGRRVHSKQAGLAAAALACFYPHFIFFSSFHLSENLFIPLFFQSLAVHLRVMRRPSRKMLLWAGLLSAVTLLVRPAAVSLAPAALAAAAAAGFDFRSRLKALGWIAAGGAVILLPWGLRNWMATGRFDPVSLAAAHNLVIGNSDDATGRYMDPPPVEGDRIRREAAYARMVLDFVTTDPWGELYLVLRSKWQAFWEFRSPYKLAQLNPSLFAGESSFPLLSWRAALALGCLGAGVLLAGGSRHPWLTPGTLAAYVAYYLLFFGSPRFRMPAEGFFLIWSGVALAALGRVPGDGAPRGAGSSPDPAGRWGAGLSSALLVILVLSAVSGGEARASIADPGSVIAAADRLVVTGADGKVPLFGEKDLAVSRDRGDYLRLSFEAYRDGLYIKDVNGAVLTVEFFTGDGRQIGGVEPASFFFEAHPRERLVETVIRLHLPPAAGRVRATISPDERNPESLVFERIRLRYVDGPSLVGAFLHPRLAPSE